MFGFIIMELKIFSLAAIYRTGGGDPLMFTFGTSQGHQNNPFSAIR